MQVQCSSMPSNAAELSFIATLYRSDPVYQFLLDLNARISMLHADVLALLYHFGKHAEAPMLELGPYLGGSSIAIARGLQAGSRPHSLVSVEVGGRYDHPTHATSDIVAGLRENLTKYAVAQHVHVVVGHSRDPSVVRQVSECSKAKFECLVVDTDGNVEQDLDLYRPMLASRAFLVVDDYYSPGNAAKGATTRVQLDRLEQRGEVIGFGVHGWGTWFGRFT